MSARAILESDRVTRPERASHTKPPRVLSLNAREFRANFNRRPFVIRHHLANHPLFALPQLVELARRLPEASVAYTSGDVWVGEGLYKGPRNGLSVEETIRRIEQCHSWMVLKHVEQDPRYRELLDACLDQVQELSEPLAPGMRNREAFIFISSPHSVTPYHIDPEYNFLLQIRGRKTVNIWDAADRSVLSEQELEDFFASSETVNLSFRDEYQQRASVFELAPGAGLHFPVTAPHWVRNEDEVSISFSITFHTPQSDRRSVVYSVNSYLRNRGLDPSPAGCSSVVDWAKFNAFRAVRRSRRLAGR